MFEFRGFTQTVALVTGLLLPAFVLAQSSDVLISHDGISKDVVRSAVEAAGGTVKVQYVNADVTAATINATFSLKGTTVEKDRLVQLGDEKAMGGKSTTAAQHVASATVEASDLPAGVVEGYANFLYTGAYGVWGATAYGDGSLVAIVDTGTHPNTCLAHAVVGAPGYPDGFNATDDGIPANSALNHWHGTQVGGVIAADCGVCVADDDPLFLSVLAGGVAYIPDACGPENSGNIIPILGQAPEADLYPVKVFPASGAGVPTSVILSGLDHVLSMKNSGELDVDIVNMSLGGPTLWDGHDAYDLFFKAFNQAHILVVTSAGNEGPKPNSVGSPATSRDTISVGAADYAPSSRVIYEFLGLINGYGPGMSAVMRPTDETRVANFSSRGPTTDGRSGPDISALGMWNFGAWPDNSLHWVTGTSFSSPTVAGGAALLNAYQEMGGSETDPHMIRNAILAGADPAVVGAPWSALIDQGAGMLDVPAALAELMAGDPEYPYSVHADQLEANILTKSDDFDGGNVTLYPSVKYDLVVEITEDTSQVAFELANMTTPDNSAAAYWPNALEIHLQGAERTAVETQFSIYWYPYWYGDATLVVEDGLWYFCGTMIGCYLASEQPMQPGFLKLTLIGDYSNESPVSFDVSAAQEMLAPAPSGDILFNNAKIAEGESISAAYEIEAGTTTATFDLDWTRMWDRFPTSDLDLILLDPDGNPASFDGATLAAPERAVLHDPAAGTWTAFVIGYEMPLPTRFTLRVNTEMDE